MTQTYTSPTLSVSDGDITSHDTGSVGENIRILNADCRWQGVDVTETVTRTDRRDNTVTQTVDAGVTFSATIEVPGPGQGSFRKTWAYIISPNSDPQSIDVDWTILDQANQTDVHDPPEHTDEFNSYSWDFQEETFTDYSASQYESVLDVTNNTNSAHEFEFGTVTISEYETQDTDSTFDPFVTRDVDGSYTGTLADGEWSAWVTLSGLEEGVNEFYHNISGSEEANFEFRYDWEYRFPEPVGGALSIGSRDGSQIHRVALADTGSSRLDYNHVRVLVGGTVYAVDVVDPSDSNAIEWFRIGTPNYGIVCPRAYQTDPA